MALAALLLTLVSTAPVPAPTGEELEVRIEQALEEGTKWLLEHQLKSGAFGSHHSARPIEVLASFPGSQQAFQVATTGLVLCSLLETPYGGPRREQAIDKALEFLLLRHEVKRQSGVEHYNVWAFGFVLQAFGEALLQNPEHAKKARILEASQLLIRKLGTYQCLDGGWGYLSLQGYRTLRPAATSMSFTTATILVGLDRIGRAGIQIPERLKKLACDSVRRCRMPDGPYSYGELWNKMPVAGINRAAGAACRTPLCQYSLLLFGSEIPERERKQALDDLLIKQARFQALGLRRPIPHESWYQISGYFYLYGHAYAGYLLGDCPPAWGATYGPLLAEATLLCRQPDGSFWDYPLYSYHKPYGTAFALLALLRAQSAMAAH